MQWSSAAPTRTGLYVWQADRRSHITAMVEVRQRGSGGLYGKVRHGCEFYNCMECVDWVGLWLGPIPEPA